MLTGRRSYELFSPVWPGMEDFAPTRTCLTSTGHVRSGRP